MPWYMPDNSILEVTHTAVGQLEINNVAAHKMVSVGLVLERLEFDWYDGVDRGERSCVF